jgi:hypothetical protein
MSDILNLIARILLSTVFIVYGYLAFADINAWLNFNQAALKRFFDLVAGGLAPPTWFGLSLSETYALKYWWCSPPRTGIASVRPTVWMVRGIGASLCSDRCVRASL